MNYTRNELSNIIAERTMSRSGKDLANEIAAFLVAEKKTADLDVIMREVLAYRFNRGIIEASLITAHEVTDQHIAEATDLLKQLYPDGKQYSVHHLLDTSMLGGAKLLVSGKQIDFTLKNKLSRFKRLTTV